MERGNQISDRLLTRPVTGVNLVPGRLRDQLDSELNLLVFLRHFGCMFCRETIADIRATTERDPGFPEPLFFFQGSPMEGKALLRRYWPRARAVADPDAEFYEGFGVKRGSLVETLGPGVWAARSRAADKGHRNGERFGDIWRMPGVFLVCDSQILWSHEFRHAADLPDYGLISELAASARPARTA